MEKHADNLENLLEEKLCLYKELQVIFEQETHYVVDMDVDSLWETIAQKKQITSRLERLSEKMGQILEIRAKELNADITLFTLSDLIKNLPVSKKIQSKLGKIQFALGIYQKTISDLALANKTYINDSLGLINDVFSMVLDTAGKKEYNKSGRLLGNKGKNGLFKAEV